ncbi:SHOCT domain-containing protein [Halorarum halobium]|uniref:SHOCT domain-containing protein n=1 Tax=Halorarum halobium TaxID=3075121 RepID=UPI0028B1883A|nr:SHOCT domain-containing protein [Halobaculum sp. XH14]
MTSLHRRLVGAAPAIFAVGTLPFVALSAILLGGQAAAIVAILGWFLLTPLSAVIQEEVLADEGTGWNRTEGDDDAVVERRNPWWGTVETREVEESDPLDRLRERYADGEIDEDEFERRLDLLLDTEDVGPETARERVRERSRE